MDGRVVLTDSRVQHIRDVLRAEKGKRLRVGILNESLGVATVLEVTSKHVLLECEFDGAPPSRPTVDLLLAMPRPKVLKRLWSQFAALGVGRIFITNAEKVERYYFDTHVLDPDYYTKHLIEGLQQAGHPFLPEVQLIRDLKRFVESKTLDGVDQKLLFDPSGVVSLQDEVLGPNTYRDQRILLGIGPEGGWTERELLLFEKQGFDVLTLGPNILRTDTACVVLLGFFSLMKTCKKEA